MYCQEKASRCKEKKSTFCRPNHISIFVSIPRVGQLLAVLSSIGNESELNTQSMDELVTLTIGKEDYQFFCDQKKTLKL